MGRKAGSRNRKPWWKASHRAWFATIGGKKVYLVAGADRFGEACQILDEKKGLVLNTTLSEIFENYHQHLRSLKSHKAAWFAKVSRQLVCHVGSEDWKKLNPDLVQKWIAGQTWGQNSIHDFIGAVKAAVNRAVYANLIPHSPLKALRGPGTTSAAGRQLITPEQHFSLCQLVHPSACDVFEVLFETATRPINLCRANIEHYRRTGSCLILDRHKTSRQTRSPTTILLPTRSREIIEKAIGDRGTGPLFRPPRAYRWTTANLTHRFRWAADELGLPKGVSLYCYKHSRATDLLNKGIEDVKVAALLGHTSTGPLHRHYSHIMQGKRDLLRILEENCSLQNPAR